MKSNLLIFALLLSICSCATDEINSEDLMQDDSVEAISSDDSIEDSSSDADSTDNTGDSATDNSNDQGTSDDAILGSWRVISFEKDSSSSTNVNLGADILDKLTSEECYIITFTFNEDLSLVAENAVNYLEINATATGLEVPCPSQMDTESSTYSYDGENLTTVDASGMELVVKVSIEGDRMSADATDLDIPNFNAAGELIFERY